MSVSDKEEGIDIERSACIRRVFKEKVDDYDTDDMKCIIITLRYYSNTQESFSNKNTPRYQYMLWEIASASKFDFFSELEKKLGIEYLKDYEITTKDACLVDQEDFYGAIIEYLRKNGEEDEPMNITIHKKSFSH